MNVLLAESLSQHLADRQTGDARTAQRGHLYRCRCGNPIYFQNSRCLSCNADLGYDPAAARLLVIEADSSPGIWRAAEETDASARYKRCTNFETAAGCNWLVVEDDECGFCRACGLNRTIPNLDDSENQANWAKTEQAKRRLVAQLMQFGLPVEPKSADGSGGGLAFDFLASPPDAPRVLTGHHDGIITLNVEEADDSIRERVRNELGEPYRTLLGHLRHEVGHYYWDVRVRGTPWHESFRILFGDESVDYAAALRAHYAKGSHDGWRGQFVSAYAAAHPWEDWAETWAHYMHLRDSLDTALGYGIGVNQISSSPPAFAIDDLYDSSHPDAPRFIRLVNAWLDLVTVLNELSRSLGQPDFYPFALSAPVLKKLHFIHIFIASAGSTAQSALI